VPETEADGEEGEAPCEEDEHIKPRERQRAAGAYAAATTDRALHSSAFAETRARLLREGKRRPDKEPDNKHNKSRKTFHSLPLDRWLSAFYSLPYLADFQSKQARASVN
jgi:hypothetical protein